jgi:hypothetical protein
MRALHALTDLDSLERVFANFLGGGLNSVSVTFARAAAQKILASESILSVAVPFIFRIWSPDRIPASPQAYLPSAKPRSVDRS